MNEHSDSRVETIQASLLSFLQTDSPISFVRDRGYNPRERNAGIVRRLYLTIPRVVQKHPKGITDEDLTEELWKRGYECNVSTINRAGRKLAEEGVVKREEHRETFYGGHSRSTVFTQKKCKYTFRTVLLFMYNEVKWLFLLAMLEL